MRGHHAAGLALLTMTGFSAPADAQDGRRVPAAPRVLWVLDKPNFNSELPVRKDLFWAGGAQLSAHRLRTGEEVHHATGDGPWHHPVLSGGLIFARHDDGSLHAFVADLSRELWQIPLQNSYFAGTAYGDMYFVTSGNEVLAITAGKVHWRFDLGSEVAMQPATDGRRVYAGCVNGAVVGIDLHSGEESWRHDGDVEFGWTSPVVDDGVLFLADRGRGDRRKAACNAFDAETGVLLWSTEFGSTGFSRPRPQGGRVWAGFGVRVASFDRATGELDLENSIRTGRNPFGLPGVVGDAIVFGNLDGNLYVHDLSTRALRWRFDVREEDGRARRKPQVGGWLLHDGVLLVGSTRGLYAIGETEAAPPAVAGFVLRPAPR
ncbi:MAG: PQQ-binding-like beta-propeller repeat protein [Planctomycetes bacterium]|nr:PQQ-binding-like beta-propeller repeat protein [Planctomycetota bacterium]